MSIHFKKIFSGIFFLFLLGFAAFFATYKITESPPVWYDEGINMQAAENVARFGKFALQVAPDTFVAPTKITTGYPVIYPVAASFKLFGVGVLQARLVMALFVVAMAVAVYMLAHRLLTVPLAAAASFLVMSFPPLYGNGKSMLGEIPGMFFLLLFLYFVHLIEETGGRRRRYYIFAGIAAGLCVASKPLFILLIPAALAGLFLLRRRAVINWRFFVFGVASFLVPIITWLGLLFSMGDSFFAIFILYANPYAIPMSEMVGLVAQNFQRLFLEVSPAYFSLLFLVWTASLGVRIYLKRAITLTETISFAYSVLVVFAYLRTAGWYRYFFTANILTLLFFPGALSVILQLVKEKITKFRILNLASVVVFVVIIGVGMHTYKLWRGSWVARSYADAKTSELSEYFSTLRSKTFFIYDVPEIVVFLPTDKYYQIIQLESGILGNDDVIGRGVPDIIVIKKKEYKNNQNDFALYKIRDEMHKLTILEKSR